MGNDALPRVIAHLWMILMTKGFDVISVKSFLFNSKFAFLLEEDIVGRISGPVLNAVN